jgi:predicted alpha/beta superfamily hydrolase
MVQKYLFLLLFTFSLSSLFAQISLSGTVKDAISKENLAYVSIGIKQKNMGTTSFLAGNFALEVSEKYQNDTLTFAMIGYLEVNLAIKDITKNEKLVVELMPDALELPNVTILADKGKEKKIGIVKYNSLFHFTDGSVNQNDIFEIGQRVKLGKGKELAKIKAVDLYINEPIKDSATFRINFYQFENQRPTKKLVQKNIIQKKAVKEGWLTFDVSEEEIYLSGEVVVAIEFMPTKNKTQPIYYEVKIGGSTKSFVRTSSLGEWQVPPHHYRMFVTAFFTDAESINNQIDSEENESIATKTLYSEFVKDSFSLFVHLPKNYAQNKREKYKTVYLLDANMYYDNLANYLNNNDLQEEIILIGIGYKNAFLMDSLRNRDYTFPKALPQDSFALSGGGEAFLSFMEQELIPYMDKNYRTKPQNRTLMGHSLGGYFCLFALKKEMEKGTHFFQNYVAASPSLDYCANYLLKEFQNLTPSNAQNRTLQLSTEGLDNGKYSETNIQLFNQFLALLPFPFLSVKSEIFPNFEHLETAIPTFEKGLH